MSNSIKLLLVSEPSGCDAWLVDCGLEIDRTSFSIHTHALTSALGELDRGGVAIVVCRFSGDDNSVSDLKLIRKHAMMIPIVTVGPGEVALEAVKAGSDEHVSLARTSDNSLARILQVVLERHNRWRASEVNASQLKALIHASEDGMVIVDDSGTVRFANYAAEKLFNCQSDELIGSVLGTPSGDKEVSELLIVRPPNSETIIAEMRVAEIDWGGRLSYLESIRDVTRQKKEAQHAREAIRMRDQFLATLSHELRNPLAALNNAAQVLSMGHSQFPQLKLPIEIIQRQCHQMVRLLDDLLDISRLSQGKVELRKEFISLSELISDCLQVMRPRIEHTHNLTVRLPSETLYAYADPSRMQQVVVNVLTNAVKYTPPSGEIVVCLDRSGDEAVFSVSDTGHGISEELLNLIFEPFVQAKQTLSRSDGGLGIGLAVVRRLVELHAGSVTADSDGLGKGATFTIRLPLSWPADNDARPIDAVCSRAFHICLVEDSADVAQMMSRLLETLGHRVTIASDGECALRMIRASPPDIVLLDLGLPGMDGFEVAEQLVNDVASREIVLVALTGYGQTDDRRRTFEAGFHYHLVKPVSLASLQSCLIDIAERAK